MQKNAQKPQQNEHITKINMKRLVTPHGDLKKSQEKFDSHELSLMNPDKITRFHTIPGDKFKAEDDIIKYYGYCMGDKFAEGGFAHVHKATHLKTHQDVACKVIDLGRKKTETGVYEIKVTDLKNEIYIMNRLNNPYIMRLYAHFVINTKLYIFMKFANNGTLFQFVKERGPVPEKEIQPLFGQMLVGIEHMHELLTAHRDLKLENILLQKTSKGNISVLITDFGLSRIVTVNSNGKNELMKTYCGTTSYMAPEVMLRKPYDAFLSDIWSLGVVLYSILNAAFPFDQTDIKIQLKAALQRDWEWAPNITQPSKEIEHLIKGIMEPDVNKRMRLSSVTSHEWISNTFKNLKKDLLK